MDMRPSPSFLIAKLGTYTPQLAAIKLILHLIRNWEKITPSMKNKYEPAGVLKSSPSVKDGNIKYVMDITSAAVRLSHQIRWRNS